MWPWHMDNELRCTVLYCIIEDYYFDLLAGFRDCPCAILYSILDNHKLKISQHLGTHLISCEYETIHMCAVLA
jgi:hypothetical protein